ncbi:MAG: DUF6599 family protein [bacterium]
MIRYTIQCLLFCVVLSFSCEHPQKGLDQLFPGPGFEKGWSWHGMPKHYSAGNLYEYIDGEAELYLKYGFQEMATMTYFWGSVDDTSFIVDIYDMGTPLDAFGLYSNYRRPGYTFEKIGTEAIVSEYGLRFFQGRYVVEFKIGSDSERIRRAVRAVAERVSKKIEQPAEMPKMLSLLPEEDQVSRTLRYIARDMLNQSFLPAGLEARYQMDGKEVKGFVVLFDGLKEAHAGLDALRAFYVDSGDKFVSTDLERMEGFGMKTSYHGIVLVALEGKTIVGVEDLSSMQDGMGLLNRIRSRVSLQEK